MVSTINQMLLTAVRSKCKSSFPAVSLMVRITLWRQAKKLNYPYQGRFFWLARVDEPLLRLLVSHQYGPGLNLEGESICGLRLLLASNQISNLFIYLFITI